MRRVHIEPVSVTPTMTPQPQRPRASPLGVAPWDSGGLGRCRPSSSGSSSPPRRREEPLPFAPPLSTCFVRQVGKAGQRDVRADARRRIADLEALVRQKTEEVQELRSVVSTKDDIIRGLGSSFPEAPQGGRCHCGEVQGPHSAELQELRDALQTKDDIIRSLMLEPGPSAADDPPPARAELRAAAGGRWPGERYFTVLPVGPEEASQPEGESCADKFLAAFFHSRPPRILFTRVDDHGHYLYGRMLVHCELAVAGDGRKELMVAIGSSLEQERARRMHLARFVEEFEDGEHAYFEQMWLQRSSS